MKLLIIFALAAALAFASETPARGLRSPNIVVPGGRLEGRITRGNRAQKGQFPYHVGLLLKSLNGYLSWCGGCLIDNKHVLTAAHCTDGIQLAVVYLGATQRLAAELEYIVNSQDFIIHPEWNETTVANDISIVNIPDTPYSQYIQPVKLPSISSSYFSYHGDEVVASGWGSVSDTNTGATNDLRYAYLTVIPNQQCHKHFGSLVTGSNVCTSTDGGVSTCSGDSGGPLVLTSTKTLIGLTSFGARDGCELGIPAVFTRVGDFLDWIQANTGVAY